MARETVRSLQVSSLAGVEGALSVGLQCAGSNDCANGGSPMTGKYSCGTPCTKACVNNQTALSQCC